MKLWFLIIAVSSCFFSCKGSGGSENADEVIAEIIEGTSNCPKSVKLSAPKNYSYMNCQAVSFSYQDANNQWVEIEKNISDAYLGERSVAMNPGCDVLDEAELNGSEFLIRTVRYKKLDEKRMSPASDYINAHLVDVYEIVSMKLVKIGIEYSTNSDSSKIKTFEKVIDLSPCYD